MYIFDKNVFISLGHFYPNRFPTIWCKIEELVDNNSICSVREVRTEIETNCPFKYIAQWVQGHKNIFMTPTEAELMIVKDIFKSEQYRGLVRRQNIIRGLPVADPFIVAAGKFYNAIVVTQESMLKGAARIPTLCKELCIECICLEEFLENEGLQY